MTEECTFTPRSHAHAREGNLEHSNPPPRARASRQDLGAHLTAIREDAQRTRRQIAQQLGIGPRAIANLETANSRALLREDVLHAYLTACGHDDPATWLTPYLPLLPEYRQAVYHASRTLRTRAPSDPEDWPDFITRGRHAEQDELDKLLARSARIRGR